MKQPIKITVKDASYAKLNRYELVENLQKLDTAGFKRVVKAAKLIRIAKKIIRDAEGSIYE